MDTNFTESCSIKSEIILTETFCENSEDCGNEELKTEPVDYKELLKCKEEDDPAEHMDTCAAPIQQCSSNERNFTTEKDSPQGYSKTTENIQYFCEYCNFRTHLETFIKKHLKIHKEVDDTYITKESNFKTPQRFSLAPHVKTLRSDEYICNKCNFTTLNKVSLRRHMTIHTGEEYKCKECDYKTLRKYDLKEHVKIHTRDEYKCKECDYKTVWKGSLKGHVKIHTGEEHKCKECDYKTVRKYSLNEHVKIHTGEEYKCKECDYKTVWKGRLNEHVKIHTCGKHKCNECDYKTMEKRSLNEHVKIHTGEEYKCRECDYKTVWKRCLKEHVKIHTGEKHKCNECDFKTVWKRCLKEHVRIHTGEKHKCNECDYKTIKWKNAMVTKIDVVQRHKASQSQREILLECLKKKPELLSGLFNYDFTHKDSVREWSDIAAILNSIPGTKKIKDGERYLLFCGYNFSVNKIFDLKRSRRMLKIKVIVVQLTVVRILTPVENNVLEIIKVSMEGDNIAETSMEFVCGDVNTQVPIVVVLNGDENTENSQIEKFVISEDVEFSASTTTISKCCKQKIPTRKAQLINSAVAVSTYEMEL
ncbi:hypothetical protein FQA39_LY17551 [Lamprigera yunnana]|nr:hypothetical protein FQA39_LY17551 [Lamprigera yunnana]